MRTAPDFPTDVRRSTTFSALRYRNFRLMWSSLLVSNSGYWLQTVAQDYLVYELSGRALDLGIVSMVRAVPLISLSFFGGAVADRLNQRRVLMVTQSLFAALAGLLGLLVQLHAIRVWHVVAASFFNAVLMSVDNPVRQSLLVRLVPREHLMNAIALNSVTFIGAAAIGPALAGPVVSAFGMAAGFYLNAVSYFAVIWAVWAMRLPGREHHGQREPVRDALVSGLSYIASSPLILLLVSLLMVVTFFAMPYQAMLPVFARRAFGGGLHELSYLRAAPGLGSLLGGLLLARFSSFPRKDFLVLGSCFGMTAALLAFSFTRWLMVALVLLFGVGVLWSVFQSTVQILMQQLTTDQMRGRVMSLFTVSVIGTWPLGALPMSWAADRFGVAAATVCGALVAGLYALALAVKARRLLGGLRE